MSLPLPKSVALAVERWLDAEEVVAGLVLDGTQMQTRRFLKATLRVCDLQEDVLDHIRACCFE